MKRWWFLPFLGFVVHRRHSSYTAFSLDEVQSPLLLQLIKEKKSKQPNSARSLVTFSAALKQFRAAAAQLKKNVTMSEVDSTTKEGEVESTSMREKGASNGTSSSNLSREDFVLSQSLGLIDTDEKGTEIAEEAELNRGNNEPNGSMAQKAFALVASVDRATSPKRTLSLLLAESGLLLLKDMQTAVATLLEEQNGIIAGLIKNCATELWRYLPSLHVGEDESQRIPSYRQNLFSPKLSHNEKLRSLHSQIRTADEMYEEITKKRLGGGTVEGLPLLKARLTFLALVGRAKEAAEIVSSAVDCDGKRYELVLLVMEACRAATATESFSYFPTALELYKKAAFQRQQGEADDLLRVKKSKLITALANCCTAFTHVKTVEEILTKEIIGNHLAYTTDPDATVAVATAVSAFYYALARCCEREEKKDNSAGSSSEDDSNSLPVFAMDTASEFHELVVLQNSSREVALIDGSAPQRIIFQGLLATAACDATQIRGHLSKNISRNSEDLENKKLLLMSKLSRIASRGRMLFDATMKATKGANHPVAWSNFLATVGGTRGVVGSYNAVVSRLIMFRRPTASPANVLGMMILLEAGKQNMAKRRKHLIALFFSLFSNLSRARLPFNSDTSSLFLAAAALCLPDVERQRSSADVAIIQQALVYVDHIVEVFYSRKRKDVAPTLLAARAVLSVCRKALAETQSGVEVRELHALVQRIMEKFGLAFAEKTALIDQKCVKLLAIQHVKEVIAASSGGKGSTFICTLDELFRFLDTGSKNGAENVVTIWDYVQFSEDLMAEEVANDSKTTRATHRSYLSLFHRAIEEGQISVADFSASVFLWLLRTTSRRSSSDQQKGKGEGEEKPFFVLQPPASRTSCFLLQKMCARGSAAVAGPFELFCARHHDEIDRLIFFEEKHQEKGENAVEEDDLDFPHFAQCTFDEVAHSVCL